MDAEGLISRAVAGAILGGGLMIVRPFRAGRRPAAIYDQICTYVAIFGAMWGSVDRHGVLLWAACLGASFGGVLAGRVLDIAMARVTTQGSLTLAGFYAASGLTCLVFAVSGGWMGEVLVHALQVSR